MRATTSARAEAEPNVPAKPRVGFCGLGIMGLPMARNPLRAGFPVTSGTAPRPGPLAAEGATIATSPRAVAEASDIVVTMVTSSPDVEALTFGPDGIAAGARHGLLAIGRLSGLEARAAE